MLKNLVQHKTVDLCLPKIPQIEQHKMINSINVYVVIINVFYVFNV